ncbi:MAG: NAD(+)/NADH kinase [Blastochloris sp.]|nr:NAD(+)/NADH kinase [Blastochloris sp.]
MGFLTSLPAESLITQLPPILAGKYQISERMALNVELQRKGETLCQGWALNEVVINRGNHAHMVRVHVSIGQGALGHYLCDGLILATPTGSTAYSLSAGGPIASPSSETVLITPICAHTLGNRPMVVSAEERLHVSIPKRSPALFLQTDGLTCARLRSGDEIVVRKSQQSVFLASPEETDFYCVLRKKLGWSGASI